MGTTDTDLASRFSFRPLSTADLPLLHDWVARPPSP